MTDVRRASEFYDQDLARRNMENIIGPDVSFYQDDSNTSRQIDFNIMKQYGANFVIIRAGQNLWPDPDFNYNWYNSKQCGLPRGSYWYYDSRVSPESQAKLWVDILNGDYGELPLFADFEESYGGVYRGWKNFKLFVEEIKKLVPGKEIGIYTGYYYWKDLGIPLVEQEYFKQFPLWIANYGVNSPSIPLPWESWMFWQYTENGDGKKYGAESSRIDLNYFNGDQEKFNNMFSLPVPVPTEDKLLSQKDYYDGLTIYDYESYTSHGTIVYHVAIVEVDKADFFVSPKVTSRKYVPQFLLDYNLDFAINADQWTSNIITGLKTGGFSASEGNIYSISTNEETLFISKDNKFSVSKPATIWNAYSFPNRLVWQGQLHNSGRVDVDPRTAAGFTQDGKKFIVIAVDGVETYNAYRTGMTFTEVSNILLKLSAYYGIMHDGGGSTTMVVRYNNEPKICNVPCGEDYVVKFNSYLRRVVNVLGVRMKTASIEEPLPPNEGEEMKTYKIVLDVNSRVSASMFSNSKTALKAGYIFQSDVVVPVTERINNVFVSINFVKLPDGGYVPMYLSYTGKTYVTETTDIPPVPIEEPTIVHTIDIYDNGKVTVDGNEIT